MMNNDTFVTTSYTTGMTINMDTIAMKMFLTSIATSLITQSREVKFIKIETFTDVDTNLPHYMDIINKYCAGVPSAHLISAMQQNAEILFQFVRDCVENNTRRGLYLLVDISRDGIPYWRLILQALDEYSAFCEKLANMRDMKYTPYYNKYNTAFEKLMLQ